jgi:hypothetical protein
MKAVAVAGSAGAVHPLELIGARLFEVVLRAVDWICVVGLLL